MAWDWSLLLLRCVPVPALQHILFVRRVYMLPAVGLAVCIQRRCFVPFVLSGCIRQSSRSPAVGRFPCGRWQFSLWFPDCCRHCRACIWYYMPCRVLGAGRGCRRTSWKGCNLGHAGWIPNLSLLFPALFLRRHQRRFQADRTTVTYWSAPVGSRLSLSEHFHWTAVSTSLTLCTIYGTFPWHLLAGLLRCGQSRCRCLPVIWTVPE